MTCIVHGYKTKTALRLAVETSPATVNIINPSPFPTGTFEFNGAASNIPAGKVVIVTNHPKRSWFATIERKTDGRLVVK